ncbi:uncharacterized protein F4807DRAFT_471206 [Annulohypoxylon truncatum]|uniref:uncharacterized protein n=1 Tax=Annulohypoxylon truncatum TaxID=327061 RepID=UPI00200853B9|nr:uncharacterized protein F4807DRAFT_471206 [Annulohypoxylon truncatum]KAI1205187.1 hypothetical protein F4807DRAFT_471206 [Annulohypoxylon truncatum]
MTDIPENPRSPADWRAYATSTEVEAIPLRQGQSGMQMHDVYLDGSALLKASPEQLYVYTDVLALDLDTVFGLSENAVVTILTRVITADAPVTLKVTPPAHGSCAVAIYASLLDQDVAVQAGNSEPQKLDLGPGSGHLGVTIAVSADTTNPVTLGYFKRYNYDNRQSHESSLETQLRIASVMFWKNTSVAISLCAHVAAFTVAPSPHYLLNSQAVALGQQLAAQAVTDDGSSYAPVLQLERYMDTLDAALDAASAYEDLYNRFANMEQEVELQLAQWKEMLAKARDGASTRRYQRQAALDRYNDAAATAEKCYRQMQAENTEIGIASDRFEEELGKWSDWQKFLAVCKIIVAVARMSMQFLSALLKLIRPLRIINVQAEFAVSVGGMFVDGGGEAAGAAEAAIETVVEFEKEAGAIAKLISSDTLKSLKKCVEFLQALYPAIQQIVDAAKVLETDPSAKIPPTDTITGSSSADADSAALVTVASWEKWITEADLSLKFAVDNSINTADTYQLALRKHAINGKLLAQAQAEAIKAGQQYVQAAMEAVLCDRDVERLESLVDKYEGQEDVYEAAKASLFDRFMGLRTSLVIEMRNITWAYKYYALKDSRVTLDVLKSTAEYRQDKLAIKQDIDNADAAYATDFEPFNYPTPSTKLPSNYHQLILDGLKSPDHQASFTLSPELDADGNRSFAAEFTKGFHYRLEGMEPTLRGALPQPESLEDGKVVVDLQISTSGLYQDVQDDQIFSFASLRQVRNFSYELLASGESGEIWDHAVFPTVNHAEPTPFTQWTIKLINPDDVDLSGLEAVNLYWPQEASWWTRSSAAERLPSPTSARRCKAQKLPYTDQQLKTVGFTDAGFGALYALYLIPIEDTFYKICSASTETLVYYRKVTDVCDYVIAAGAGARKDYDIIFDGLAELYKDPDNESLHRQIDQTIKDRVETLRIISDVASTVKTDMTSSVRTIIENQAKLGEMEKPLQDSSTISKLLRESDGDDEDYQQDMEAVQSLLKIMGDQKMEDQSGPTLSDLEKLLGGAVAILSDMTSLQEEFEEDAKPGPDLVLNLEKNNLVEMWDSLVTEGS